MKLSSEHLYSELLHGYAVCSRSTGTRSGNGVCWRKVICFKPHVCPQIKRVLLQDNIEFLDCCFNELVDDVDSIFFGHISI